MSLLSVFVAGVMHRVTRFCLALARREHFVIKRTPPDLVQPVWCVLLVSLRKIDAECKEEPQIRLTVGKLSK